MDTRPFSFLELVALVALIVDALVGCAGHPPPPAPPVSPPPAAAAPPPERPAAPVAPAPHAAPPSLTAGDPSPPPQDAAPAAPPPSQLYARLRDAAGAMPGLAGFALERRPDAHRCGGVRVVVHRGKVKPTGDDQPLADVLAIEFPTGLDFIDAHKAASQQRFQTWLRDLEERGERASDHYKKQLEDHDARVYLAAAARVAQIRFWLASTIARAEIPADVATGAYAKDQIDAYCDALATAAEPLQAAGEEAARACADKIVQLGGVHGWWDAVCTP